MKNFFAFIKSRSFLKHFGIAVGSLLVLFWIVFKGLEIYTHHGQTVSVPDFNGLKIKALPDFIKGKQLKYLVIDSIYDTKRDKGVVIKQEPEAGASVKQDRTIYLYVTSVMPPRVLMPNLKDRSLRLAIGLLETYGLKLAKPLKRKPDVCNGCVLSQECKGKTIAPGTPVERGSEITLTIGEGRGGRAGEVGVPSLIGLTLKEALSKLNENNLSEGTLLSDPKQKGKLDTARAFIYRQNPASGEETSAGSSVDFYLTNDRSKLKSNADSTLKNH
jgi:beta-lactam-binding protein with PASTA domain